MPMMQAKDIDDEGVWRKGEYEISLLGSKIPIPENVQDQKTQERGLFIVEAKDHFQFCPKCRASPVIGIVIVTESVQLFPAKCCDTMLWFKKGEIVNGLETE
tara:strand:+ start:152 stop:457 length:306 start_codon:yes stop_codon:yes gene_type:complete